ncbi:MAG: hypothetical protein JRF52_07405 [Deltaproteobacteria bacterium]|nr:hypothetical protein [Deltaproteobacteria bacterium]
MKKEELISALGALGYRLFTKENERVNSGKVLDVLDELSGSEDSRLIEAYPVVLANCAHRGIKLDISGLLSRHGQRSHSRSNLEKLILASCDLLAEEGLDQPEGIEVILKTLRPKYGDLLQGEVVDLGTHRSVSTERLRRTLRRYAIDLERHESAREKDRRKQLRSFQLELHLSTLFPPKQKELIFKKLKGDPLSKTEKEYYSRVVKKKLQGLANKELRKIALTLTKE